MRNERAPDFMVPVGNGNAVFGWDNAGDLFDGPIATLNVVSLSVGGTPDGDIILFVGVETEQGFQKLAPVSLDNECAHVLQAALGSILDSGDEEQ